MASPICEGLRSRRVLVGRGTLTIVMMTVVWRMGAPAAMAAQPSPAAADDPQARAAATARLVEGVELLRLNRHAEALRKFDEAYALVPSPNIHYNRGLALRGLGQNAAAIEAFDTFVASATHPPPGKREQAQQYRNELRARVARVALTSALPGAELLVDGRPQGFATAGRIVYLDPGPHELLARRNGGSARAQVTVAAGQELAVTMRTAPATVAATPPPAATSGTVAARDESVNETTAGTAPATNSDNLTTASPGSRWTAAPRWTFIAAAGGVLLLGAGATFELLARREGNLLSEEVSRGSISMPVPWNPSRQDNGLRYQTLGFVSLAAGGAALIAGVSGYLIANGSGPEREHAGGKSGGRRASLTGQPLLTPAFTGARLEVAF
jgi:hypothetical protein